ncbi:putative WD40 repeats [Lyophyllum shimeji]|uniref:WD40 repeats n=1 Tax=Lyophyllum shimeji TaxID=47721 RepID=A0A9P3UKM7_LYOSH|nr:putative WD40 repeats [Lyophyllum shimeji]
MVHTSDPFQPNEWYTLQRVLQTPAHITCLASGHAGHVFAGSADGSLRVYDLSSFKVIKAVRGLGAEVSSVACVKRAGSDLPDAWVACGSRIMNFQMDSPKMILTADDALTVIDVGDASDPDDVLNELSLNYNETRLAFCTDSGVVGVVDLSTKAISRMRTKHESVCGSVKFIPDRPRELVSGGYDSQLRHFDFHEGKLLSIRNLPADTVVGGVGMSPPFVMSMAMSSIGIMAAGTADGRLVLGCGGYKPPKSSGGKKKKRSRKWEGLDEDEEVIDKIAEGPIVAMAFDESDVLTVSTLLGTMVRYVVMVEPDEGSVVVEKVWQQETQSVKKVNALVVGNERVIVGGLTANGTGVFEIWKQDINYALYGLPMPNPRS